MSDRFRGTGVALVTPFRKDLSIDEEGLKSVTDYVIDNGVDYLVVMGTTGENPTLSWIEQLQVLEMVFETSSGRLPVVFGLGGNNTAALLDKFDDLSTYDLAAILSVCPYYNRPSQGGMIRHFTALADRSPFDIILYDVPARTGSTLLPGTVELLSGHDKIIGLKDAVGDPDHTAQVLHLCNKDFIVISGDDNVTFDMIQAGGQGVISVLANCLPYQVSEMVRLTLNGDMERAESLQKTLHPFYSLITREGNPSSVKAGLKHLGICDEYVRLPLDNASVELINEFGNALSAIKKDNR